MPAHPTRYYGGGDLHFITAGCYHRQPFLGAAQSRDLFLCVLEQMRRRYRFAVLGYVVMPEHFHLLVSEPQRMTLSTVVQALKPGFSRRLLSPGKACNSPACDSVACGWLRAAFGRRASMTSMYGPNTNGLKNCAICIATQ